MKRIPIRTSESLMSRLESAALSASGKDRLKFLATVKTLENIRITKPFSSGKNWKPGKQR